MSSFFKTYPSLETYFAKHGEDIAYEKGQHLVWRNDESLWVYLLRSGFVRASFSFPDGTRRIIGFFVPGSVFAQSGSFFADKDGMLSYSAETPVTVLRVKRSHFLQSLDTGTDMAKDYLDLTLRNQIFLVDRLMYQGEAGIRKKFARWLLFMCKYYCLDASNPGTIRIPLTQTTIADFLHITRESANAVIKEFVDKEYIRVESKVITIIDRDALKILVGEKRSSE